MSTISAMSEVGALDTPSLVAILVEVGKEVGEGHLEDVAFATVVARAVLQRVANGPGRQVNMYGQTPCPDCGSTFRYATKDGVIHCDECRFDTL